MKKLVSARLISLFLAVLTASCSSSGYWVPPSSPPTAAPALAFLSEPTPPQDAVTEPDEVDLPVLIPVIEDIPEATPTFLPSPSPLPALLLDTATPEPAGLDISPILYYTQAADTLPVIAIRFGVDAAEITSPDPIPEKDFLNPGQLLVIPRRTANTTSSQKILPDSEIVFSPSAIDFDIEAYVQAAGGRLSTYKEWLKSSGVVSGAEVVKRVALENSINPRLLLALLEYHGNWVHGQPGTQTQKEFPLGLANSSYKGLYHQLVWTVNQLSVGYYSWREGRLTDISFAGGVSARLAPELNAGSVALQYYFAQLYQHQSQQWVEALDLEAGLAALHVRMFGNPWERAQTVEPLFPPGIQQPPMILPFAKNWQWGFTGGPHGAYGNVGSFAALDFAPGSTEAGCVKSNAWTAAAASGLVVRSGNGVVAIDLDGDGYEQTGWVLFYLHISSDHRIPVGTWVDVGDPLGHPSCEGGMSTGTHLHIARKYNGEWIPAYGPLPFNLGGWVAQAGEAAYKGTLTRDGVTVTACTCTSAATRIIRTNSDP